MSHLFPSHSTPGAVKMISFCYRSDSAIASATASALDGVEHPARPVLEEVGNVAQSVAVGEEVPASCAVTVIVEPRAKDQVCGNAKEDAAERGAVSPKCQICMKQFTFHLHNNKPGKEAPACA